MDSIGNAFPKSHYGMMTMMITNVYCTFSLLGIVLNGINK